MTINFLGVSDENGVVELVQKQKDMPSIHDNQKGFTIIEAIFAVLILAVVTAGIGKLLLVAMATYNFNFAVRSAHHEALNSLAEISYYGESDCWETGNPHGKHVLTTHCKKKKDYEITIGISVEGRISPTYIFAIDSNVAW